MAYRFDADGDHINLGTSPALDAAIEGAGTWVMWVRFHSTASDQFLWDKRLSGPGGGASSRVTPALFEFTIPRATTNLLCRTNPLDVGKWWFVAGVWDVDLGDSYQRIYAGSLTHPPIEAPTGYLVQQQGSGAVRDDSAVDLYLPGDSTTYTWMFQNQDVGMFHIYQQQLGLHELTRLYHRPWEPIPGGVLLLPWGDGAVGGSTKDLSGSDITGTVPASVAVVPDPVPPLTPRRFTRVVASRRHHGWRPG